MSRDRQQSMYESALESYVAVCLQNGNEIKANSKRDSFMSEVRVSSEPGEGGETDKTFCTFEHLPYCGVGFSPSATCGYHPFGR